MNTTNLMKDPFYSGIMFRIESTICSADKRAQEKEIFLTDSNVKSSLSKAKGLAQKGELKSKAKKDKEMVVFDLAYSINDLRDRIYENTELKLSDWLLALRAVEDSIKLRMIPGGRAYLDYLVQFIAQAKSTQ